MKLLRNICVAIFITIDVEQSSLFAKVIGFVSKMVVVLAVLAYIISTDSSARYVPVTCDMPYCNNDPMLCPGKMFPPTHFPLMSFLPTRLFHHHYNPSIAPNQNLITTTVHPRCYVLPTYTALHLFLVPSLFHHHDNPFFY